MSPRGDGLSAEGDVSLGREVSDEVIPLAVEQDASQVQDHLGTVPSPAHAGPVEAYADQVADGALDDAGADVEVLPPQAVVAHADSVLAEVGGGLLQDVSAVLVAGTGRGGRGQCAVQLGEHIVELPATQ